MRRHTPSHPWAWGSRPLVDERKLSQGFLECSEGSVTSVSLVHMDSGAILNITTTKIKESTQPPNAYGHRSSHESIRLENLSYFRPGLGKDLVIFSAFKLIDKTIIIRTTSDKFALQCSVNKRHGQRSIRNAGLHSADISDSCLSISSTLLLTPNR